MRGRSDSTEMMKLAVPRRNTPFLGLGVLFTLALLGSGCGSGAEDRPPPAPAETDHETTDLARYDNSTADSRDVFASGGCEEGATQPCRIYLASHDGVQPCFVGVQECTDSAWGECGNAVLVDANANDEEIEAETTP
jgi:hypothetical protein